MRVRIIPNHNPVKVKVRRYNADQRFWMDEYIDKLVEMGFLHPNPHADWQAAPLLVPKKDSKTRYRMAIDLRPVNPATLKETWPMPNSDVELLDFAGSSFFATLDFVSGYWQLPIHPDSYSSCGIVTPTGVYCSKRVLPGLANATAFFQRSVEPLFAALREHSKAWLDDFGLHAASEHVLLDVLEHFFQICRDKGLFLSAKKCKFFQKSMKWCGRLISGEGYTMEASRIKSLQAMQPPAFVDELSTFIHGCRWMALSLPDLLGKSPC